MNKYSKKLGGSSVGAEMIKYFLKVRKAQTQIFKKNERCYNNKKIIFILIRFFFISKNLRNKWMNK